MMDNLKDIPEPVGQFIIDQQDIKPLLTGNGAYYHYVDVIKMLERYAEFKEEQTRLELISALREMIIFFKKSQGEFVSKYHKDRIDAAENMLKKHSHINDILR